MKKKLWLFLAFATTLGGAASAQKQNTLSKKEKAAGWELLFNGKDLSGWRMFRDKPADCWEVVDGTLHCKGSKTDKSDLRADIITQGQFGDFEFTADWKLGPQGNSGILYRVSEDFERTYMSGPEYQLIDDNNFPGKLEPWQKTGANYAINPPLVEAAKPIGQWNTTKIIVRNNHVEHWLNGKLTAEYTFHSDDWKKKKAEGKWKNTKSYGMSPVGHIALQDHGAGVWFKNIKIRKI
ncbi:DUF1080 domain-containing protein [Pedobacter yulinensis]|uniref:DUF1080 domain-containing protein n=1 Tax=Pedobacter yulinensis TaxID=2126353 RepID=A0A2T3HKE9_9SPHI|nr:DUF1080 domain-containing protein [Pedobacter yulinensis]PST82883.1 DUF1080 domain-containing protein [Pedobacter yulinensis]